MIEAVEIGGTADGTNLPNNGLKTSRAFFNERDSSEDDMRFHFSVRMDLASWWNTGDEKTPVGAITLEVNGISRELPIRSVSLERSKTMKIVLGAGNPDPDKETLDLQLVLSDLTEESGDIFLSNCALRFRSSPRSTAGYPEDYSFSFSALNEEGHYAIRNPRENNIVSLHPVSRTVALRNENDGDGNLKISGSLQCLYASPEQHVEISQSQFDLVL